VLISAVFLILKFIELFNRQTKWRGLFIILYAVISFSLLKNILDGGILDREAPVALAGLILVLLLWGDDNPKSNIKTALMWSAVPIIIYGALVVILWQSHLISIRYFLTTLYPIATLTAVIGTLTYWQFMQRKTRLGILLTVLAAAFVYIPVAQGVGEYIDSVKPVGEDGALIALYQEPDYGISNPADWEAVETINDLTIYKVSPSNALTTKDLIINNHLLNNLSPITLPWTNCLPANQPLGVKFTLLSTTPLGEDDTVYQLIRINKIQPLGQIGNLHQYKISAVVNPCAPRPLNLLQELLKKRGLETFFLLNISDKYAGAY
jgi:hypothetical protein